MGVKDFPVVQNSVAAHEWYNSPATLKPFIDAEDLNVANLMVANSPTDGVFDREFFRGQPDPISGPHNVLYWNEEFRATLWGHIDPRYGNCD